MRGLLIVAAALALVLATAATTCCARPEDDFRCPNGRVVENPSDCASLVDRRPLRSNRGRSLPDGELEFDSPWGGLPSQHSPEYLGAPVFSYSVGSYDFGNEKYAFEAHGSANVWDENSETWAYLNHTYGVSYSEMLNFHLFRPTTPVETPRPPPYWPHLPCAFPHCDELNKEALEKAQDKAWGSINTLLDDLAEKRLAKHKAGSEDVVDALLDDLAEKRLAKHRVGRQQRRETHIALMKLWAEDIPEEADTIWNKINTMIDEWDDETPCSDVAKLEEEGQDDGYYPMPTTTLTTDELIAMNDVAMGRRSDSDLIALAHAKAKELERQRAVDTGLPCIDAASMLDYADTIHVLAHPSQAIVPRPNPLVDELLRRKATTCIHRQATIPIGPAMPTWKELFDEKKVTK